MHSIYFNNEKAILSFILAIVVDKKVIVIKTSYLALITKNTYECNIYFNFSKLFDRTFFKTYFYYFYCY